HPRRPRRGFLGGHGPGDALLAPEAQGATRAVHLCDQPWPRRRVAPAPHGAEAAPPLCPAYLHARGTPAPPARPPILPTALSQTGAPHTAHDDTASLWCGPPRERSRRPVPWGRGLTQRPAHRVQHEIS